MLSSLFATKMGMTQAWNKTGKRLCVTKCRVNPQPVIGVQKDKDNQNIYLMGFGKKKLSNMTKPLQTIVKKGGFSLGVSKIKGVRSTNQDLKAGDTVQVTDVLHVGDVVKVRGVTKGRGFAGAVKRFGFAGGPKTHGQSDRHRAVGAIGCRTTPGKVNKGKRMPGHYGVDTMTVTGLVVLHIDQVNGEVWLNGPVPGSVTSTLEIMPMGETKAVELDTKASGIVMPEVKAEVAVEETAAVDEVATEVTEEAKAE
jgi:large subunit ribosomal protein L3